MSLQLDYGDSSPIRMSRRPIYRHPLALFLGPVELVPSIAVGKINDFGKHVAVNRWKYLRGVAERSNTVIGPTSLLNSCNASSPSPSKCLPSPSLSNIAIHIFSSQPPSLSCVSPQKLVSRSGNISGRLPRAT